MVRCCKKVERKYIQEQQPNQLHCYNHNWGSVNRMDQNVTKYMTGIQTKKWWWSMFVWMVDVVLQGVWVFYRINKDEGDESLPLLAFRGDIVNAVFLKYSKEDRFSSSHIGIRNWIMLWWHKTLPGAIWPQAYSEPLQTSKMEFFCVNS